MVSGNGKFVIVALFPLMIKILILLFFKLLCKLLLHVVFISSLMQHIFFKFILLKCS